MKDGSPPERWFSIFGVTVVPKADVLAAAAFIIAFSTAAYQVVTFLSGSRVTIYHPDTLYILFDTYPNGQVATRFAGQTSFANAGDVNASAVIRDVSVLLRVSPKLGGPDTLRMEEHWFSFARLLRNQSRLEVEPVASAHPEVIAGNSAGSEMVTFSPQVRDCGQFVDAAVDRCDLRGDYVSDVEFLNSLAEGSKLIAEFTAHTIGKRQKVHSSCVVAVTSEMLATLAENEWFGAHCADFPS